MTNNVVLLSISVVKYFNNRNKNKNKNKNNKNNKNKYKNKNNNHKNTSSLTVCRSSSSNLTVSHSWSAWQNWLFTVISNNKSKASPTLHVTITYPHLDKEKSLQTEGDVIVPRMHTVAMKKRLES